MNINADWKRGQRPLCFTSDGLLVYYKNKIYLRTVNETILIGAIRTNLKSKFVSSFRLFERIVRNEPKCAICIEGKAFIATDIGIIEYDISDKKRISITPYRKKYIHTSKIIEIKSVPGFSDTLVYGEYFGNSRSEEVCIFAYDKGEWKVKYTFEPGRVRHIHTLIPDPFRSCVYILTGDKDSESGIWVAKNDFNTVEPLLVGTQEYRTYVAFVTEKELLFATDTPSLKNHLYAYNFEKKKVTKIADLPGTCLTGCATKSGFVFGTVVEAEEIIPTSKIAKVRYLLSRKKAAGITDDYAHCFYYESPDKIQDILKLEKDIIPPALGQFGRINVLYNQADDNLLCYPIAVKKFDGHAITLEYKK